METFLIFGGFVLGLILLVKGADEMIKSAIQIAVKFKLPTSKKTRRRMNPIPIS